MVHGLQIVISGDELGRRIGDRIPEHQTRVDALDARLKEREGDPSFDARPDADFKTVVLA